MTTTAQPRRSTTSRSCPADHGGEPEPFSAKLRERDEDVRATLEPHTEGLLQTAALLTGDRGSGMALLERALYQTYLQWHQAKDDGPVETVRQHLSTLAPTIGERAIGNTVETP